VRLTVLTVLVLVSARSAPAAEQFVSLESLLNEMVDRDAAARLPQPGYLEFLREITRREGALLIFDEVKTGFTTGPGGVTAMTGEEDAPAHDMKVKKSAEQFLACSSLVENRLTQNPAITTA